MYIEFVTWILWLRANLVKLSDDAMLMVGTDQYKQSLLTLKHLLKYVKVYIRAPAL